MHVTVLCRGMKVELDGVIIVDGQDNEGDLSIVLKSTDGSNADYKIAISIGGREAIRITDAMNEYVEDWINKDSKLQHVISTQLHRS